MRDIDDPVADQTENLRRRIGFGIGGEGVVEAVVLADKFHGAVAVEILDLGAVGIELADVHGFPSTVDERQNLHDGAAMRPTCEVRRDHL